MIMKTKHVKNTGQLIKRGQIGKLPGGGKGGKLPWGKRGKLSGGGTIGEKKHRGGALPLLHHSYGPQLIED